MFLTKDWLGDWEGGQAYRIDCANRVCGKTEAVKKRLYISPGIKICKTRILPVLVCNELHEAEGEASLSGKGGRGMNESETKKRN